MNLWWTIKGWPPQSMDLNIIEADKKKRALNVFHEAWKTIPEYYLKKYGKVWLVTQRLVVMQNIDFEVR